LAAFAAVHLIALHEHGSGNPLGLTSNSDRLPMHPYFTIKDSVTIVALLLITVLLIAFIPNALGHSDNYIKANAMSTPLSIVPEWYLLSFYAILRSIPNKIFGVIGMLGAILVLMALPILDLGRFRGAQHRPFLKATLITLAGSFIILLVLGGHHVENPFIVLGQITSAYYFGVFLIIIPFISLLENTLLDIK
jgi:ubiquinol-cytochrome c reductase cytochrome b subunit